jgi:hypothetical protein
MAKTKSNVVELPRVNADTVVTFRHAPKGDLSPRFQRVVDASKRARKGLTLQALFKSLGLETKTAWQDTVWIVRQLAREGAVQLKPAADIIRNAAGAPMPEVKPIRVAGIGYFVTAKGIAVAFSNDAVLGRLRRVLTGKADPRMTKALLGAGLIAKDKREAIRVDHNEMVLGGVIERMRQVLGGREAVAS